MPMIAPNGRKSGEQDPEIGVVRARLDLDVVLPQLGDELLVRDGSWLVVNSRPRRLALPVVALIVDGVIVTSVTRPLGDEIRNRL